MLLDKSVSHWAIMDRITSNVRPTGHRTQYTLTDNDVEIVNLLKNWYREITGNMDDQMEIDVPAEQLRAAKDDKNKSNVDIMNHPIIYATGGNRPILPTNKISDQCRFLDYIGMVNINILIYITTYSEYILDNNIFVLLLLLFY